MVRCQKATCRQLFLLSRRRRPKQNFSSHSSTCISAFDFRTCHQTIDSTCPPERAIYCQPTTRTSAQKADNRAHSGGKKPCPCCSRITETNGDRHRCFR